MRLGIFNPDQVPAGLRWQRLAATIGHEIAADESIQVLCVFGGLRTLLQALRHPQSPKVQTVWWCEPSAPGSSVRRPEYVPFAAALFGFVEHCLSPVDEVLAGDARTAQKLARLLGLQATVVRHPDDGLFAQALDDACNRAIGRLPSSAADPFVPRQGHVLPYSIAHDIPGFTVPQFKRTRAFSPSAIESEEWFNAFADRVEAAIGNAYLPVCRMSDGEYLFRFGWQPHLSTEPAWRRLGARARHVLGSIRRGKEFRAGHPGRYQSARYTEEEQREGVEKFDSAARFITKHGVLALHLSHEKLTFQERFYPAIASWLRELELPLTTDNYVPFYFVYALLTGPRRHAILSGRRVLVINGSTGEKRDRIIAGLLREGASEVHWESISPARSLFDKVNVSAWRGKVDLALVGAGVGKVNVLPQLEPLEVPCLDAGYVFEIWADAQSSRDRFYCTPDDEGAR